MINFNIMLPLDRIAQAYQDNLNYGFLCYIVGPLIGDIPQPQEELLNDSFYIDNEHLFVDYEPIGYKREFSIDNGHLILTTYKGGVIMAVVDLGNVQGATGPQGPQGATGPQGPQGEAGISPTFSIGDGTGGTIAGHLYADYDNPYTPTP